MTLSSNETLKAKIPKTAHDLSEQMDRLRANLKNAYKPVTIRNRTAHQTNKRCYDRRPGHREFKLGEWVYLYNPARKPGLSRKFCKPWSGPFQITAKVSDLNYEILGHKDRKMVLHVNRLKAAHGDDGRELKPRTRRKRRPRKNSAFSSGNDELTGIPLGTCPLVKEFCPEQNTAPSSPLCPSDSSPLT